MNGLSHGQLSTVGSLREQMYRAWETGNATPAHKLTYQEQKNLILERYPNIVDDVWRQMQELFPKCASIGLRRAGIRFEYARAYSEDSGEHGDASPVEVRFAESPREDDAIVVSLGTFLVGGIYPVQIPIGDKRGQFAKWLYGKIAKRAEEAGFGVWTGYNLVIEWASSEELAEYEQVIRARGQQAFRAGVPARDIVA